MFWRKPFAAHSTLKTCHQTGCITWLPWAKPLGVAMSAYVEGVTGGAYRHLADKQYGG
jgi:hypothetical protein